MLELAVLMPLIVARKLANVCSERQKTARQVLGLDLQNRDMDAAEAIDKIGETYHQAYMFTGGNGFNKPRADLTCPS